MPKSKSIDLNAISEDKIGKGQDNSKEWKGPSHKDRMAQKTESKKAVQRALYKKEERASWKKQIGGIVALFFICGAGLFQFFVAVWGFMRGTGLENVDIKDTAKVKSILFSGEPWFVYCVNNETVNQRLPKVLEEGALALWSSHSMRTAVLDCWEPTESGRSISQRFQLNKKPPLSFVVANGNKPRVLNLAGVTAEDLEKRVNPALKLAVSRIDTLKKWPSLCTSRKTCLVIGHKNVAQRDFAQGLFNKALLEKYRAARVVTLDTSFWQLKLGDAIMTTRAPKGKKGKSAEVVCLSRDEGKKEKGNATHSGTFLQELDASEVDAFMQACLAREGLVQLEKPPKINARPSKPKKVTAAPPSPRPSPPPPPVKPKAKSKVDHVGSRQSLESEEPLFEAVEEDEEGGGEEDSSDETPGDSMEDDDEEEVGNEEDEDDEVEL